MNDSLDPLSIESTQADIADVLLERDELLLPTMDLVHVNGKSDAIGFAKILTDACLWQLISRGAITLRDGKVLATHEGIQNYLMNSGQRPDDDSKDSHERHDEDWNKKWHDAIQDALRSAQLKAGELCDREKRIMDQRVRDISLWCQTTMSSEQHDEVFSRHAYGLITSLEREIHRAVIERLRAVHGDGWWKKGVPVRVRVACGTMEQQDDSDAPVWTYMTLIHLMETIVDNWNEFAIQGRKADFESCFKDFNKLRNVVMHPSKGKRIQEADLKVLESLRRTLSPLFEKR